MFMASAVLTRCTIETQPFPALVFLHAGPLYPRRQLSGACLARHYPCVVCSETWLGTAWEPVFDQEPLRFRKPGHGCVGSGL